MRNVLYILILVFAISCKNYKKEELSKSFIKYTDWYSSAEKNINKNLDLKDYEKDNLLSIVKSISEEDFLKLRNTLNENNTIFEKTIEYYILSFSEGEVVTIFLYYIVNTGEEYLMTSIDLTEEKKVFKEVSKEIAFIKKKLIVKPFDKKNEYQDMVILTKFENKLVSIIGNPIE